MENIDKIKSKYIEGKASDDELKLLSEWLKDHPEEKKELFFDKDILDSYSFVINSANYSEERALKRFLSSLHEVPQNIKRSETSVKFNLSMYLKIAAVFIFAFIMGWAVKSLLFNPDNATAGKQKSFSEIRKVVVPKAHVNQFFLADGTRIWVNSGSTIEIPSVFTGPKRVVTLYGEAFFEVANDPEHPFLVKVRGQTIEVLGTSFNVRAYENSSKVQTTLETGTIKLITSKGDITLSPGQQATLNKATGQLYLKEVNPGNFDSWKDGRYEFVDEDIIEVFHMVERWYNVELIYKEDDFKTMKFSGVIKRENSVQHFLTLLGHSIPIQYAITSEKIKIEKL